MSYSKQEVLAALELYNKTKSVRAVIDTLGYPAKTQMYEWIKQMPDYVNGKGTKKYKVNNTLLLVTKADMRQN